jgi:hypothetical protein
MISRQPIGGMKLREMSSSISLCDRESRPSINDPLGCCNLCSYPIGSGKRLLRISSWDCLGLSLDMISLWIIVDRLTMVAHFRPVKTTYTGPQLAELSMPKIVCFHGVLMRIVSDGETQVISNFWERLHETLDTHWNFSSAYHSHTDGQPREQIRPQGYAESLCSIVRKMFG